MPRFPTLNSRYNIPDIFEIHLAKDHPVFGPGTCQRQSHVGLGPCKEIDGAVVDLVVHRGDEGRLLRVINMACDHVLGVAGHSKEFPPISIQLRYFGDRLHLAQQPHGIKPPLITSGGAPRQQRGPGHLVLDLADVLADAGGCGFSLAVLNSHEQGSLFLVGKPDINQAAGHEREADNSDECDGIFAKKPPPRGAQRAHSLVGPVFARVPHGSSPVANPSITQLQTTRLTPR